MALDSRDWKSVRRWRRLRRAGLLEGRLSLTNEQRRSARDAILTVLQGLLSERAADVTGLYWPFRAEIDVRHAGAAASTETALPVVVERNNPLEFWRWRPGDPVRPGVWDIPVPESRSVVRPTLLLVPLLGFDDAGYRLGYGGGYYDRTLAGMSPRPFTIGIGFESGRLPTIYPQSHDIPMDVIVTEEGVCRRRNRGGGTKDG